MANSLAVDVLNISQLIGDKVVIDTQEKLDALCRVSGGNVGIHLSDDKEYVIDSAVTDLVFMPDLSIYILHATRLKLITRNNNEIKNISVQDKARLRLECYDDSQVDVVFTDKATGAVRVATESPKSCVSVCTNDKATCVIEVMAKGEVVVSAYNRSKIVVDYFEGTGVTFVSAKDATAILEIESENDGYR